MQISTKTVVEIEAKELAGFLKEVEKLLYDMDGTNTDFIRDYLEITLAEIENYEKSAHR